MTLSARLAKVMESERKPDPLDHPCKHECSGWSQGWNGGALAESNRTAALDLALRELVSACAMLKSEDDLPIEIAHEYEKLTAAIEALERGRG